MFVKLSNKLNGVNNVCLQNIVEWKKKVSQSGNTHEKYKYLKNVLKMNKVMDTLLKYLILY